MPITIMPDSTLTASNASNLTYLHADVSDTVRAAIAFGAGQKVQYRKPSTGEWTTVHPKFNPSHNYRPAADAVIPAVIPDDVGA